MTTYLENADKTRTEHTIKIRPYVNKTISYAFCKPTKEEKNVSLLNIITRTFLYALPAFPFSIIFFAWLAEVIATPPASALILIGNLSSIALTFFLALVFWRATIRGIEDIIRNKKAKRKEFVFREIK